MADFKELLKVLGKGAFPSGVVRFYLNERLYRRACKEKYDVSTPYAIMRTMVRSFEYYGYDYATVRGSEYWFSNGESQEKATISLNAGHCIVDRISFDRYPWMGCRGVRLFRIAKNSDGSSARHESCRHGTWRGAGKLHFSGRIR